MALTNEENNAKVTAEATVEKPKAAKGKTKANTEVLNQGAEIIASMSEEQRSGLASKSGTLHFQHLLGLASRKAPRKVAPNETVDCSTPVGIVLVSDEDIQVPVIDITKDKDTGIDPETDISYRTVKAGEEFDVSYYEFMYLIVRDEYAGLLEANGDENGAYFSAKLPAYMRGTAKLPTPTLNLRTGSVKATMVDVDEEGPNGFQIKPQYADKYGALLRKSRPQRAAGKKSSTPPPTIVAVALQKILGVSK